MQQTLWAVADVSERPRKGPFSLAGQALKAAIKTREAEAPRPRYRRNAPRVTSAKGTKRFRYRPGKSRDRLKRFGAAAARQHERRAITD